jgi:integrase
MYCLSFYALLRISEVHRLTWGDINTGSGTHVGVTVPYSKTSLTPVVVRLAVRGDWACPKAAYEQYLLAVAKALVGTGIRPRKSDPLFINNPKVLTSAVTEPQSQQLLKSIIARTLNVDPTPYAWHSFRRGGCTAMLNARVPDSIVQSHGRWRSDCYIRYYDSTNIESLLPTQLLQLRDPTAPSNIPTSSLSKLKSVSW